MNNEPTLSSPSAEGRVAGLSTGGSGSFEEGFPPILEEDELCKRQAEALGHFPSL